MIFGSAQVSGNARIADNAWVFDNAEVSGYSWVSNDAKEDIIERNGKRYKLVEVE